MSDVAVVLPMFSREQKLANLLNSIENTNLQKVYIADNGELTENKDKIYSKQYKFDLNIFDLEYNSGIGNCRHTLVTQTDEDFLLCVDSDMEVPLNYELLVKQLRSEPRFGGIGGVILEPERGRITSNASNIHMKNGTYKQKNYEKVEFETIDNTYLAEFDFIQQAAVFRRECLEDYCWDKKYKRGVDHRDFFLGHKLNTDWSFGVCPQVLFPHYPGGDDNYNENRASTREDYLYFREKWNIDSVETSGRWIDTNYDRPGKIDRFKNKYRQDGIISAFSSSAKYVARKIL